LDTPRVEELVAELRAQRAHLEDDPYLHYATERHDSSQRHAGGLPESAEAVEAVVRIAEGLDLVGLWAKGSMATGFANSLGQRNWHSTASFHLDWSCYDGERAVKCDYAGHVWDAVALRHKMDEVRVQLAAMARPIKTLQPGRYRVYLAPAALREVLDLVAWGGFSLRSHRTQQTPLIKMVRGKRVLDPRIRLTEHHAAGLTPSFTGQGFVKPAQVRLVEAGEYCDCLASERSAKEYGVAVNAASEFPCSLEMAAGDVPRAEVLAQLGTGLYINNLWYLNYSDPNDCRITGMTRFACWWVEAGELRAPINVMRFDDSLYHVLGDGLLGLTQERELLLDASTYEHRSSASMRLPGALIDRFSLTL
jgi:predicted Zn-dependent protease